MVKDSYRAKFNACFSIGNTLTTFLPMIIFGWIYNGIVTAQLNQIRVGVTRQLVCNPPHPTTQTFRPLPDNLGS